MTADQTAELIRSLKTAAPYPHSVTKIELIETHISWVFLAGNFAYKLKKPVNLGFVDFSTLERRRFFCEEELRLNRRLAPQLYVDVLPITGSPAAPQIGGQGTPYEFCVRMRQFGVMFATIATVNRIETSVNEKIPVIQPMRAPLRILRV